MAKKKKVVKKTVSKKALKKKSTIPNPGNFKPGNDWWNRRSKHGREKLFTTPGLMWEAACEYFQWVIDNPLKEQKVFCSDGFVVKTDNNKMRAMTMHGLCLYLDCATSYFRTFKQEQKHESDFLSVIAAIEAVIYNQKFEGAAAGLLNANIISRDLGLAEKVESKVDDPLRKAVAELFPFEDSSDEEVK